MSADRFHSMQTFVRVIEAGSFSAAGRSLGISQSQVSKIVRDLEERLGARLINRTTRHLTPTDVGMRFYEKARDALALLHEAETQVAEEQGGLRGVIRINTASMLGVGLVVPAAVAFVALHAGVEIEMIAEDRRIDPVEERVDLIVRLGALQDSTLTARRAGAATLVAVATQEYLSSHPPIETALQLRQHRVVGWLNEAQRGARNNILAALPRSSFRVSNALLALAAALSGGGIAILPQFLIAEHIADGRLKVALDSIGGPSPEVHCLHPFGRNPPRRVTDFIEYAINRWRQSKALVATS